MRILFINTGGTFSMKNTGEKYVLDQSILRNILQTDEFHRYLDTYDEITIKDDPIFDSKDLSMDLLNYIVSLIDENIEKYDHFVYIGGTDTLKYVYGLLKIRYENYLIKNQKKLVMVGAMEVVPSMELLRLSDSFGNLLETMKILAGRNINFSLYLRPSLLTKNSIIKENLGESNPFKQYDLEIFNSEPYGSILQSLEYQSPHNQDDARGIFFKDLVLRQIFVNPFVDYAEILKNSVVKDDEILFLSLYGDGTFPKGINQYILKFLRSGKRIYVRSQIKVGKLEFNYEDSSILNHKNVEVFNDLSMEDCLFLIFLRESPIIL